MLWQCGYFQSHHENPQDATAKNAGGGTVDFKKAENLRNKLQNLFAKQEPGLSVVIDKNDMKFEDDEGWRINIF